MEQNEPIQASLIANIKDELEDAEKYLAMFRESGDREFLQLSFDESTHGMKFVKMAKVQGVDVDNYERWVQDLQERISRL